MVFLQTGEKLGKMRRIFEPVKVPGGRKNSGFPRKTATYCKNGDEEI